MRPVRDCYPGTTIPLIRGGAPAEGEQPAGGKPAASPAAPAGGGSPAAASAAADGKPDKGAGAAPPAEDWQKKYSELEGRYKQYERFGKPEDIDAFAATARTNKQQLDKIYADFQEGKLTYAQAKAAAKDVQEPTDPFDGYDALEPREQGQRLMSHLRKEFEELTKAEFAKLQATAQQQSTNMSTQMKLAWKLMTVARDNPDVSLDDIIAESTAATNYTPEQIIDLIVDKKRSPKQQEQAIAAAVAKAKAEWQREADAKRVPPRTSSMPRMATREKPLSAVEKHDKTFGNFMERLDAANNGGK